MKVRKADWHLMCIVFGNMPHDIQSLEWSSAKKVKNHIESQYLKIAIHIESAPKYRDSIKLGDKHIVPAPMNWHRHRRVLTWAVPVLWFLWAPPPHSSPRTWAWGRWSRGRQSRRPSSPRGRHWPVGGGTPALTPAGSPGPLWRTPEHSAWWTED